MKLVVLGSGAMGTALAGISCKNAQVDLWSRDEADSAALRQSRRNHKHLPQYELPVGVQCISGPVDWGRYNLAILAFPTQHLRAMAQATGLFAFKGPVVNLAKGLELGRVLTPCAILADMGFDEGLLYALSGPSHAEEMSAAVPTSVVLAGRKDAVVKSILDIYEGTTFRPYFQADRLGVELGGALKNIIAIAAGIADGLGFGMNTKSLILTRGLSEIRRYGVAKGARPDTFNGLSCLGDLVTTCCSPYSRNRAFGEALVRQPETKFDRLAEGATTVISLIQDISAQSFDMPICKGVHDISTRAKDARTVMRELIARPFKEEN